MIDPESIQNHSRMVQGPPGYHKTTLNDSWGIFLCSLRVIRRQGRASLKIPKLRHLGDLGVSKLMNLEIYEKVWLRIFFLR